MIKVTVNINGMDYNLKGDKNEQYLVDLADFVDSKVKEIMSKNSRLSTSAATVLAAVNIADELYECDFNLRNAINKKKNIETEKSELIQKVDKLNEDLKTTLVEKTKIQEQLVNGEQSLKEKYAEIEQQLDTLGEEATNLKKEKNLLLEKNTKLENSLREVNNLKNVLNKEVVELKERNKILNKKVDESKGKEVDLRSKLQESSGKIKELENKCNNLDNKFNELNILNTDNSLELEKMIKVKTNLEEENSILMEKSKSLEDNCLTLQKNIEELTLLVSNEKSNKQLLQEEYIKCKTELENISDLYYETDKEVINFKQKIEQINKENEKLNSKINIEVKNKRVLEENIQKLNSNINSINNEKNKIKQENSKLSEELKILREKNSKLVFNEDNNKKTINIKHKEIEELKGDLSNKDKSLIDIKSMLNGKEKTLEKLKVDLDEKEKSLETLKNTLSQKDASVVELENKVEELNKHKITLMERSKTVNNNLRTSKYKVMELKDKLLNVEIELAALKRQQLLNSKTKKIIAPLSHKK
ncbi:cell division protein ZapA [Clostridium sp. CH2]|uniref:cell division protein ZapA n=1 Tax=Clostridium sp. CH2 TaxID=2949990 RepID=UPI00207A0C6B|nr:cell division protein ZapA [Clostridium sp. CH2]